MNSLNTKITFCLLALLLGSLTDTFAHFTDSLKITAIGSSIKLNKRHSGISLKLNSPDETIFTSTPEDIFISISSETSSCMTTKQWEPERDVTKKEPYRSFDQRIYVFIYDDKNSMVYPEYHFTCDKFYSNFTKWLEQGILKICLYDYALTSSEYSIKLIYYSVDLDMCLPSNSVKFKIEK